MGSWAGCLRLTSDLSHEALAKGDGPGVRDGRPGRWFKVASSGLKLEARTGQNQTLGLAKIPLTVLQVFPIPYGGSTVPAIHANIIEFNLGSSPVLPDHHPAPQHFNVALAFRTKNAFRVFDMFHGRAPSAEQNRRGIMRLFAPISKEVGKSPGLGCFMPDFIGFPGCPPPQRPKAILGYASFPAF